jgi:hypothetical protein
LVYLVHLVCLVLLSIWSVWSFWSAPSRRRAAMTVDSLIKLLVD